MLRFLSIRHLAVIDRIELEFGPGLTVLTGETGAGKSILVGAVGLLVGGRASAELVRTGEESASVEAIFDAPDGREIIVKREVSAQGRSRAFVDGALVTNVALRELSGALVDLHGQHEHQVLLDPTTHLDVLDAYAGLERERADVAAAYSTWQATSVERDRLLASQRESAARSEFVAFQLAEIERVNPKPGEDDELAATRQVLANADKLQRLCNEAYQTLYEGDGAALSALGAVWRKVGELAAIDERFAPHLAARESIKPALEDLAYFLRSYVSDIDAAPARLQEVEDRLAALERLKKKHGLTLAQVLARSEDLKREIDVAGAWVRTIGRARPVPQRRARSVRRVRRAVVGAAHIGRACFQPNVGEIARRSCDGAHALRGALCDRPRRGGLDRAGTRTG